MAWAAGIHLVLLLMPLLWTATVGLRGRAGPIGTAGQARRVLLGLTVAAVVFLVPFLLFACTCGAGNNPLRQTLLPAASAFACVARGGTARVRVWSGLVMLAAGLTLSWHFQRLVLPDDMAACRFTGDAAFVGNSCSRPVDVGSAWYTPLTGLHPLTVRSVEAGGADSSGDGAAPRD